MKETLSHFHYGSGGSFINTNFITRVFLLAQMVKNLPAMQETRVQSLGWEDSLEKGLAAHSSILAWEIPCTEKPGGLQSMGSQSLRQNLVTKHQQGE